MRLIDADKIKLPQGFFEKVDNVPKFYEWLDKQPTVDAVEVVRCKDCRHWVDKYRCQEYGRIHQICEVTPNLWTGGTYFCALGERRENDGSN